jgi:EAL domain-containing protein (putative c-di-GMP-specific phosphodiesterase class I)
MVANNNNMLSQWQREGGTVVSLVDFIPIAEETGLIIDIGERVLRESFSKVKNG